MAKIVITKGGFALVPEGKQIVHVDEVNLLPAARPQVVEFKYSHESGATIKETLNLDNDIALNILGKRSYVALEGIVPEGYELDPDDLPDTFKGKTFEVQIKHNEGKKGGTFANIHYFIKLIDDGEVDATTDDEEDDL